MSLDSKELAALEVAIAADPTACASLAGVVAALKAAASGGASTVPISATASQLIPVAAALAAKPTADGIAKPTANGAGPNVSAVDYKESDVVCKSTTQISFSTPRGKFECKLVSDGRCVLEQRTAKGVTAYEVRPEHVRRVMRLDIGDSNNTTYVMIAIDPDHAPVAGKQKMPTLLTQVRGKDNPVAAEFLTQNGTCPGRAVYEERMGKAGDTPAGAMCCLVELLFGLCAADKKVAAPKTDKVFAGVGGRGCVKANHKFNQGHLFMFDDGLAFGERPALWLPWSDVADLQLQRADGTSGTFDLRVTPEGSAVPHEFAAVSREELEEVQRYLAKRCSEAGDEDEREGVDGGDGEDGENAADMLDDVDSDEDSDEDDEDFNAAGVEEDDEDDDDEDGSDDDNGSDEEGEEDDDDDDDDDDRSGSDDFAVETVPSGRKRARDVDEDDDAVAIPGTGGVQAMDEDESEEEEEDEDSDDDGAFEVVAH